jgi:hypothetical protein
MDIIIKAFQTYYKLPELLNTECDWVQWTRNIEFGSSENLMCKTSKVEENARRRLLETNKSFENLLVTLIQYHFEKGTIKKFTEIVEYEDSYKIILDLAKDKQLQNLFDFSIYDHWPITYVYPEVIYITQFLNHIFKTLYSIFKALNKASIKSYNILESRKPTKLIEERDLLEQQYKQLSSSITDAVQKDYIDKLIAEQNALKNKINDIENKIIDKKLKKLKNRIDQNLILGDKFINGFVYNTDIITYLIFLNTETIPIELFDRLNTQLKIPNSNFLLFLLTKFNNVIKQNKICYLTKSDIEEFEKGANVFSKGEELKTLLTSQTISPTHKISALFTKFIQLSDPLGESILYSIIQKLGFGSKLSF